VRWQQQAEDLGFPWVALNQVQVMQHRVLVQLLASDTDPDSGDEWQEPEKRPDSA
jgi:hypothetical protein